MISDGLLGKILSLSNIDRFSAVEIRTAYLALKNDPTLDPSLIRKYVYVELSKLVKKGWLKKSVSEKKGLSSYVKTDLFDPDVLEKLTSVEEVFDEAEIKASLTLKLHGYKEDLLEGAGEIEEYKQLRADFPDFHETLQEKSNDVRESNSLILGKIKALEALTKLT